MFKKVLIMSIIAGVVAIPFFTHTNVKKPEIDTKPLSNLGYNLSESTKEKLFEDIFVSLLAPYSQKAVSDYYGKYLKEIPSADPNFDTVLSVERVGDDHRLEFIIKLEVLPYIGPHNSVGRDHLTFKIHALGEVILEEFDHLESFQIPPNYQDIIKTWPPK